jgi:hypothetical protein
MNLIDRLLGLDSDESAETDSQESDAPEKGDTRWVEREETHTLDGVEVSLPNGDHFYAIEWDVKENVIVFEDYRYESDHRRTINGLAPTVTPVTQRVVGLPNSASSGTISIDHLDTLSRTAARISYEERQLYNGHFWENDEEFRNVSVEVDPDD